MGQNFAGRRNHYFRKSAAHRARHQWPYLSGTLVSSPQKRKDKIGDDDHPDRCPQTPTPYTTAFMLDGMNQCVLSGYSPSTSAVYNFQGPPTGKLPNDVGSVIHEDVCKQIFAGVETTGTRTSVI